MATKRDVGVTLRFSVSYWTRWGQSVIVTIGHGSEGSRRHGLNCRHQGDALIWEGEVQVPSTSDILEYSYAIVDEAAEIEAEEISKRSLAMPEGLADGSIIELRDSWQVDPSLMCFPASFRQLASACSRRGHELGIRHAPSEATLWTLCRTHRTQPI